MLTLRGIPAGATLDHVMATKPGTAQPLLALTQLIMRGPSELSPGQRELIAAVVSGLNNCRSCLATHRAFAEAWGEPVDEIDRAVAGADASVADTKLRPLLDYCRVLTTQPWALSDAHADAVFAAGWSEEALLDAIWVTSLFGLYNRLSDGVGLQPRSEELNARVARFVKRVGYDFTAYENVQVQQAEERT